MNTNIKVIFSFIISLFCSTIVVGQVYSGTVSPATQTIASGATPTAFTATAPIGGFGPPPYSYSFQWEKSTNNGSTWSPVSGATSGSGYTSGALTVTTWFRLYVEQTATQFADWSNVVVVTIASPLVAGSISPTSATINYNTSQGQLTGTLPSGGVGGYTYYWQKSSDNSTWTGISGATNQHYTPGLLTQSTYFRRAAVSGSATEFSNSAYITVLPQVQPGSVSPTAVTINYGTSPGQITGTSPSGGNGTFSYQWHQSANGTSWSPISGATAIHYTPGNLTATTYYKRAVTSNGSTAVESNVSTVTVLPQIQPGSISPATVTINYGTSPGQITGTIPSGGNGTFSYQWHQSANGTNWTLISGATAINYTPGNLTASTYYKRSVTSNGATAIETNTCTVTVLPQVQPGTISPSTISVSYNMSPGQLTGTQPTGGNGSFDYQWQQSPNGSSWSAVSGATGNNYTPGALSATTHFRRSVSSNGSTAVFSNASVVTVIPQLHAGTISGATFPENYNDASYLSGTVASGGSGPISYQWQRSSDSLNWTNIVAATNQDYHAPGLTVTTFFRRKVTAVSVAFSNVWKISVLNQLVAGTIIPGNKVIATGTSPGVIGINPAEGGVALINTSGCIHWTVQIGLL
ncbi:hypothetical protein WJU16_03050 [Chitinophaga pollutisoli]|uniref:Ig-like domain-containing protein n=1 Tax=Chitinophaga pollutisoli TaxID=3133966 RepID=A0ABZ2YQG1_9BACT